MKRPTKRTRIYAFWRHGTFPFIRGGEGELLDGGWFKPQGREHEGRQYWPVKVCYGAAEIKGAKARQRRLLALLADKGRVERAVLRGFLCQLEKLVPFTSGDFANRPERLLADEQPEVENL